MNMSQLRPISDSPWFWMLVYGGWTFAALALLSLKYGTRQSQLERQYQGRMFAAEKDSTKLMPPSEKPDTMPKEGVAEDAERNLSGPAATPTNFSSPENTIIALWPLTLIFLGITALGGFMLWRERRPAGTVPSSI